MLLTLTTKRRSERSVAQVNGYRGVNVSRSQDYISQIETTTTAASVDTVEKLADGLGASPDRLLLRS